MGERVTSNTFGGGVIVSATKSGPAGVRFDDGSHRSMDPNYLQVEIESPPVVKFDDGSHRSMSSTSLQVETTNALFGLARLVEAEEAIAGILSRNAEIGLSNEDLAEIEWVLDHAAELLNRPGFVPNTAQRQGVLQAFRYRFSIVTGPPGTGKTTAVVSLVCAAAARIYPGDASPILGVALAGRAASVLRDAAVWWNDGEAITMPASTIHRALQMESVDEDDFVVYGRIESHSQNAGYHGVVLEGCAASHGKAAKMRKEKWLGYGLRGESEVAPQSVRTRERLAKPHYDIPTQYVYINTAGDVAYDFFWKHGLRHMQDYQHALDEAFALDDGIGLLRFKHIKIITYDGPGKRGYRNKGVRISQSIA